MTNHTDENGWKKHEGGKRPVHIADVVQVKFREHEDVKDQFVSDTGFAGDWTWWHDGNGDDIVSYRIVPKPPVSPTTSEGKSE